MIENVSLFDIFNPVWRPKVLGIIRRMDAGAQEGGELQGCSIWGSRVGDLVSCIRETPFIGMPQLLPLSRDTASIPEILALSQESGPQGYGSREFLNLLMNSLQPTSFLSL